MARAQELEKSADFFTWPLAYALALQYHLPIHNSAGNSAPPCHMLLIPQREGIRQHARPVETAFEPVDGWVFRLSYLLAYPKELPGTGRRHCFSWR
jgi:hypothetical protein